MDYIRKNFNSSSTEHLFTENRKLRVQNREYKTESTLYYREKDEREYVHP